MTEKPKLRSRIIRLHKRLGFGYAFPSDDHVSYAVHRGRTVVISEPYSVSLEDMKQIIAFAERHGLVAHVDGISKYKPGDTLRIIWCAKEDWLA